MCVCHAAPGGDLCPAAGRDGNVVWRRPDSLYAHGYIAARSIHGLHAQQPQLLFRGLMYIHRALVGPRTPHLYTIYINTDFYMKRKKCQAAQKIVCVVKIKRNFIFFALYFSLSTYYLYYLSTPMITVTMYMSCLLEPATIYI